MPETNKDKNKPKEKKKLNKQGKTKQKAYLIKKFKNI